MEDIIDLIANDAAPSEISATIKDTIYSKAAERIDSLRPDVALSMFGGGQEVETSTEEE